MSLLVLFEGLITTITCVLETIYWIYHISLFFGHFILLLFYKLFSFFHFIVVSCREALNVLIGDFDIFKRDITSICTLLSNSLSETGLELYSTVKYFSDGVVTTFNNVFLKSSAFYNSCSLDNSALVYIKKGYELFFGALTLIGKTAKNVFHGILIIAKNIPDIPFTVYLYTKNNTLSLLDSLVNLFSQEAVCGLFLFLGITFVFYKSKVYSKILSFFEFLTLWIIVSIGKYLAILISSVKKFFHRVQNAIKTRNEIDFTDNSLRGYSAEDLRRQLEKEKAEKLCVICMDKKRNAMLLTCKHLVLCSSCAYMVRFDSAMCPVCRKFISEVIIVYT